MKDTVFRPSRTPRIGFLALAWLLCLAVPVSAAGPTLFTSGFEGGGPCAWSDVTPSVDCPPVFYGIVLMAATNTDEITLAWLPAVDDDTAPVDITYEVHLSQIPDFDPSPTTLVTTVVGEVQYLAPGLDADTVYYALIIAKDPEDNRSYNRDYRSVTTPAFPPIPNPDTPLELAEDLNLGAPIAVDTSGLTFGKNDSTTPPTVGALLVGPFAEGGGYARIVESVNVTATEVEVGTADGAVDDAFDQHHLPSTALVSDANSVVEALQQAERIGMGLPHGLHATTFRDRSGSRISRIEWPEELLTIETTSYQVDLGQVKVTPTKVPGRSLVRLSSHDFGEVTLEIELEFKPELVTNAKWRIFPPSVKSAELIAIGELSLDASAKYEFLASATVDPDPFQLFKVTWTAVYSAGPIPVYQEITLELQAEFDAISTAAIAAEANASATASLQTGVTYDKSTGWQPLFSPGFASSLSANLEVVGTVQSTLRLIPELSVEFYEVITGRISAEPTLRGQIQAEESFVPLCLPIELTQFDFDLELDCFAGVDFTPFSKTWELYNKQICDPDPWVLFNLPEFDLASSGDGPVDLNVSVVDRANNRFKPESGEWQMDASTAELDVVSADPPAAVLKCFGDDRYPVTFAGNGSLGRLGRQCLQLNVNCTAECPIEVGSIGLNGNSDSAVVAGAYAYVADSHSGRANTGLRVVDISTPSNPVEVGYFPTPGAARGVALAGNHVFVADGNYGLRVVDVSVPSNPVENGFAELSGFARFVTLSGSHAFVTVSDVLLGSSLKVVDISAKSNPVEVGSVDVPGTAYGVTVSGVHAYVAANSAGLRVIDISSPSDPVEVGFLYRPDESDTVRGVDVSGNYAYAAAGRYADLLVVDISDPTNPVDVGSVNSPGTSRDVVVSGAYAFLADGVGLRVVDVSSPATPMEVGFVDSDTVVRGLALSGSYVYLTSGTFYVIDVSCFQ